MKLVDPNHSVYRGMAAAVVACSWLCSLPLASSQDHWKWESLELPVQLGVGYAVRAVDMNEDGRLDVAIVDSKRVLWCENPDWQVHVIYETPDAKFDNVCFAPHDINQDGKIDFALGADWQFNNANSGGSIGWLENSGATNWKYHLISEEPTTHRMQWVQWRKNGPFELIVAPLKGKGSSPPAFDDVGIRLLGFTALDKQGSQWQQRTLTDRLHVMHNMTQADLDGDGTSEILAASYEGVTVVRQLADGDGAEGNAFESIRIGSGQDHAAPARGASEIRMGQLSNGQRMIGTIEPWHGDKVVVYTEPQSWKLQANAPLWNRWILDDQLAWGHAVDCADLNGDGVDEMIAGVRDDRDEHRRGVRIYQAVEPAQGKWERTLVEPGAVAVEDLVAADFDNDGRIDIVAVGRATHNAKIYFNRQP